MSECAETFCVSIIPPPCQQCEFLHVKWNLWETKQNHNKMFSHGINIQASNSPCPHCTHSTVASLSSQRSHRRDIVTRFQQLRCRSFGERDRNKIPRVWTLTLSANCAAGRARRDWYPVCVHAQACKFCVAVHLPCVCYNDKRYRHGSIQHCEFINVITVSACKHSSHKQKEVLPVDSVEHTTESFTLVWATSSCSSNTAAQRYKFKRKKKLW